jgi:hypothetical protein
MAAADRPLRQDCSDDVTTLRDLAESVEVSTIGGIDGTAAVLGTKVD